MFLLGLVSIIQITLLPGLLILKIYKVNKGFIQNLVLSFGLSLIFNHIFVVLLTHLGINLPVFHYLLFICEVVVFGYLFASDLKEPIGEILGRYYQKIISELQSLIGREDTESKPVFGKVIYWIIGSVFVVWAIICLIWALNILVSSFGSVFTIWDSVVSWNQWAVEWFSNSQPLDTKRYAQLIPTNFSVTYSFMQSEIIQFFAIGFMPLFPLFILLLMLDLGLAHKNLGYIIGLVATRYILNRFYSNFFSSGYVDVPLAFFTCLTVYLLLKSIKLSDEEKKVKYVFLGFIMAAGAALTKQNGLFVFSVYPLLAYLIVFRKIDSLTQKEKIGKLVIFFLISLSLLIPWYIFNEIRILEGAKTNILLLISQDHHRGLTRIQRLVKAYKDLSVYFYLYPFVIITLPLIEKDYRKIVFLILFPYTLIWAFFFSKYTRNLSIALPLLGMATGLGADGLIRVFAGLVSKWKIEKVKSQIVLGSIVVLFIGAALFVPSSTLIDLQTNNQKLILEPEVNQLIYQHFDEKGKLEPIFTNYPLRYLPGFEQLQIKIGGFEDYNFYKQKRADYPDVKYMLISLYKDNDEVVAEIQQNIKQGNYELIFSKNRYMFVHIVSD